MGLPFGFFNFYVVHFIQTISNDFVVSVVETKHIVIIFVPNHNYRICVVSLTVFTIYFVVFFVIIKVFERNLFVIVDGSLYSVNAVNKGTVTEFAFIKRHDIFGNKHCLIWAERSGKFADYVVFLRNGEFRRFDYVGKQDYFRRIERAICNVIVMKFLLERQNFITIFIQQSDIRR